MHRLWSGTPWKRQHEQGRWWACLCRVLWRIPVLTAASTLSQGGGVTGPGPHQKKWNLQGPAGQGQAVPLCWQRCAQRLYIPQEEMSFLPFGPGPKVRSIDSAFPPGFSLTPIRQRQAVCPQPDRSSEITGTAGKISARTDMKRPATGSWSVNGKKGDGHRKNKWFF